MSVRTILVELDRPTGVERLFLHVTYANTFTEADYNIESI